MTKETQARLKKAFDDFCYPLECPDCKYHHCDSMEECFKTFQRESIVMIEDDNNYLQQILEKLNKIEEKLEKAGI